MDEIINGYSKINKLKEIKLIETPKKISVEEIENRVEY